MAFSRGGKGWGETPVAVWCFWFWNMFLACAFAGGTAGTLGLWGAGSTWHPGSHSCLVTPARANQKSARGIGTVTLTGSLESAAITAVPPLPGAGPSGDAPQLDASYQGRQQTKTQPCRGLVRPARLPWAAASLSRSSCCRLALGTLGSHQSPAQFGHVNSLA